MPKQDGKKSQSTSHTEVHVESTVESHVESDSVDQLAELEQDLVRVQADFMNYKRRSEVERIEIMAMAKQSVIVELLPLLDNVERALNHVPTDLADNDWAKGVAQVGKQASESLAKLGVEKIATVGEPFDPHLHEAVVMEDGEGETEVVTEELQAGYKLGDRVVRPAMVKVGRK